MADGVSGEEEHGVLTAGTPDDAQKWCVALYHLITDVHGEGRSKPSWWWYAENDDVFVECEAERHGFHDDFFKPFTRLPYYETLTKVDYMVGRSTKVDAVLFGITGETFGDWQSYILFHPTSIKSRWCSLEFGQMVQVGTTTVVEATAIRILRGLKPAGTAAENRTQWCYYALLATAEGFKYAALQHVINDPYGIRIGINDAWDLDIPCEGEHA